MNSRSLLLLIFISSLCFLPLITKTECIFVINPGTIAGVCTLGVALKDGWYLIKGSVEETFQDLSDKPYEEKTTYEKAKGAVTHLAHQAQDKIQRTKQVGFHQPSLQFTGDLSTDYLISLAAMAVVGSMLIYYASLPINNPPNSLL